MAANIGDSAIFKSQVHSDFPIVSDFATMELDRKYPLLSWIYHSQNGTQGAGSKYTSGRCVVPVAVVLDLLLVTGRQFHDRSPSLSFSHRQVRQRFNPLAS